jgi:hypothetical protein
MISHHSIKTICVLVALFVFNALLHKYSSNNILFSSRLPHSLSELDAYHIIEPDVGSVDRSRTETVVDHKFAFSFEIPHCTLELDARHIIEPDVDGLNCNQTERVVEWNSYGQINYNVFSNVTWELSLGMLTIPLFGVGDIAQTMLYIVDSLCAVECSVWNCTEQDYLICNIDEDIRICAIRFVLDFVTVLYRRVISIVDVSFSSILTMLAYEWSPYPHTLRLSTACGCLVMCVTVSVATAIADVFRKNGINVGRKFAKIMKILDKIDDVKSRGVI